MAAGFSVFVQIGAKLLPSLNSSASAIERRFGQMNRRLRIQAAETKLAYKEMAAAVKPIAAMAAAGGLSMGIKGIFGSGKDYAHEIAMLKAAGRTTKEVSEAIASANRTIREIPTSTLTDNLKIINETTGAFGNFHHALENLSFNSKLGYMMTNMMGTDPTEVPHTLNSLVQALEVRGTAMDPEKYRSDAESLFRAMVFTRGRFNAEEFKAFTQTGNLPVKLYDQRFMSRVLPSLITELGGGDIVGTQAAAFRNQIMGRVALGGKKMTEEWIRLGLVPKNGTPANMSKTGWLAGSAKGHALAMRDPFAWVEQVLLPAFTKAGIDINNQEAVLTQIGKMFGRETAGRFVSTMADPIQRNRLHKDEKMIGQALPLEDSYKLLLATDPTAAMAKTMAAIENLSTRLGSLFTDDVIKGLDRLAAGINWVADTVEKHPALGKIGVTIMGFGALAAILKTFGIALRWIMSPLRFVWGLLFTAGPRQIGIVGWIFRGLSRGVMAAGRMLLGMGARLGPWALRGLASLGPWLLRGALAAFGLLSNPVGWAILAASVALLIWRYREELARGWEKIKAWFTTTAWPAVRDTFKSIDWGAVGMAIADAITFGLASKLPGMLSSVKRVLNTEVGFNFKDGFTLTPPAEAKPDGKRAMGGNVRAGGLYQINERGQELFMPGRSGTIIPAGMTRRLMGGGGGLHVGEIHVHGATDPHAAALAVRAELARYARQQEGYLND